MKNLEDTCASAGECARVRKEQEAIAPVSRDLNFPLQASLLRRFLETREELKHHHSLASHE